MITPIVNNLVEKSNGQCFALSKPLADENVAHHPTTILSYTRFWCDSRAKQRAIGSVQRHTYQQLLSVLSIRAAHFIDR